MFLLPFSVARADCTLSSNGEVKATGALIYNKDFDVLQTCGADGRWKALGVAASSSSGTDPCVTGAVGTRCTDGSFYIGELSGGPRLYAAPADESGKYQWKGINSATAGTESMNDGYSNTYPHMTSPLHPAGDVCAKKTPAGTWFLPAYHELDLIWQNATELNLPEKGFKIGTTEFYWSSSEHNGLYGWQQRFTDGQKTYYNFNKIDLYSVRCVRH